MSASRTKLQLGTVNLLRFIAALAVVAFHYLALFPKHGIAAGRASDSLVSRAANYGYLGVDLFFIISGFVVAISAEGKTWRQFVVSRASRLYPMLWIMGTLTYGTIVLRQVSEAYRPTVSFADYLANMTLIPNFFRREALDGSYWTLWLELKFYVVVGTLLATGLFKHVYRLAFAMAPFLVILVLRGGGPSWYSYFVAGTVFYRIYRTGETLGSGLLLLVLFAVSSANAQLRAADLSVTLGVRLFPEIVSAIILIFYVVFYAISVGRLQIVNFRIISVMGGITYPLYLIHQEFGSALYHKLGQTRDPVTSSAFVFVSVLVIALVGHLLVEQRLQKFLARVLSWILLRNPRAK